MSLEVNERLKFIRKYYDMTQKEFADAVGLSQGNVSGIEKGNFKPSIDTVISTCEYFGLSTEWLLLGKGPGPDGIEGQTQNIEAKADPDLKQMYDVLKNLMQNPDSNLRGWAIVQFQRAFGEYCVTGEKEQ
ncbi:MAG: helix-turn-helix transcriptional regulator [Phycisphaerales bacterium]